MGPSGQRARSLKSLIGSAARVPDRSDIPRPKWDDLAQAGLDESVVEVYKSLGGVNSTPRVAPGTWDMQMDEIGVELDEEHHFNRYREVTLVAGDYGCASHVDVVAYRNWCSSEESACLTHSGYWTNESCEREFGPAGPEGQLDGLGSPRWKQRAFYDFIKDLAPQCFCVQIARLSIYESVTCGGQTTSLGEVLYRGLSPTESSGWALAIAQLITDRSK